jgi:hypothetical protein
MGQVVGRSTANGGEPADNPVHMSHLIGTISTRCSTSVSFAFAATSPALSPSSSAKVSRSSG